MAAAAATNHNSAIQEHVSAFSSKTQRPQAEDAAFDSVAEPCETNKAALRLTGYPVLSTFDDRTRQFKMITAAKKSKGLFNTITVSMKSADEKLPAVEEQDRIASEEKASSELQPIRGKTNFYGRKMRASQVVNIESETSIPTLASGIAAPKAVPVHLRKKFFSYEQLKHRLQEEREILDMNEDFTPEFYSIQGLVCTQEDCDSSTWMVDAEFIKSGHIPLLKVTPIESMNLKRIDYNRRNETTGLLQKHYKLAVNKPNLAHFAYVKFRGVVVSIPKALEPPIRVGQKLYTHSFVISVHRGFPFIVPCMATQEQIDDNPELHLLGTSGKGKYRGLVRVNGRLNEQQTEVDRDGKLYMILCQKITAEKIELPAETIHPDYKSRADRIKEEEEQLADNTVGSPRARTNFKALAGRRPPKNVFGRKTAAKIDVPDAENVDIDLTAASNQIKELAQKELDAKRKLDEDIEADAQKSDVSNIEISDIDEPTAEKMADSSAEAPEKTVASEQTDGEEKASEKAADKTVGEEKASEKGIIEDKTDTDAKPVKV